MTTHRELFDEAEAALARASMISSQTGSVTAADGARIARQHNRLLGVLARHLEYLYGHAVAGRAQSSDPTGRDRVASCLLGALHRANTGHTRERAADTEPSAARAVSDAADRIGLATDVLATHHRPGMGGRTPDAQIIEDADARWGVTARLADLACTAALVRTRLTGQLPPRQRTRDAHQVVRRTELAHAARGVLITAGDTGPGSKGVLELTPFAAPLPTTNPLAPAATALQYARAETHLLAIDRRLGVTALRDVALLGMSIAQHTEALTRAAAARADHNLPNGPAHAAAKTLAPAADDARALARRWRDLHEQLRPLRSPDPPQVGLAHAALAVRAGLETHTRRDGRWATPEEMHPTREHMEELLTGIRALALPLDELAAAGQRAVAALQRRGQAYIDARALPPDPRMLHAQSTGQYLSIPDEVSKQLTSAWGDIAEDSRKLTTSLAASTGPVGQHPRHTAALARTGPPGTEGTGSPAGKQRHDDTARTEARTETPAVAGDAPNIEAARQTLRAIVTAAGQAVAAIDTLTGSLTQANLDHRTLSDAAAITEAADCLKATAEQALSGMNHRHAALEEALNATPRPATTRFYRHAG